MSLVNLNADLLRLLEKFCQYQERCNLDVERKALSIGITKDQIFKYIDFLSESGLLSEWRFVESYVISKFHQNKWGKLKIKAALQSKRVEQHLIDQGIQLIPIEEYLELLKNLIKSKTSGTTPSFAQKGKLIRYLAQKGFEMDLIYSNIPH